MESTFVQSMTEGTLWAFVVAFGSGVATSLTPCVYPMIPITVGIFGAKEARSRRGAFWLATLYVMGIAVTYTALGVVAALAGWATGSLLSSPYFVWPMALFFLAMATSLLGLWDMRVPDSIQHRLSQVGGRGAKGAFLMGLGGGILIAPCTGPWLGGLLGYVATTRNIVMGGGLLFTYAIGIGVLFWVIATFAVAMPKAGRWMEAVKSSLGVIMLAAALYYVQNVVALVARYSAPSNTFLALNIGLVVVGIAIGALHLSYHSANWLRATRKTVGALAMAIGLFGLANYALAPPAKLHWQYDEQRMLAQSQGRQAPVLIDLWAPWCTPCKKLEADILAKDPAVRRELERFVLFKIDIDQSQEIAQRYGGERWRELPLLVMLDSRGKVSKRINGKSIDSANHLLRALRQVR
ncbi:MAG: thioredoxin family protein [Deltaproteobacteria bacterium]|nr:thioredoxin family protein [Deltaproteobacteria bacterium]